MDSDAGENAQKYLSETFGKDRILFCHCDVTDYVQYEEAFQSTLAEFDGLDIVVNNAEIMNDKFWELEVDVNLVGFYDITACASYLVIELFQFRTVPSEVLCSVFSLWEKIREARVV